MLKKLFIGLLVLSVLSSALLFFVLKKNSAPEVHVTSNSPESEAHESTEATEGAPGTAESTSSENHEQSSTAEADAHKESVGSDEVAHGHDSKEESPGASDSPGVGEAHSAPESHKVGDKKEKETDHGHESASSVSVAAEGASPGAEETTTEKQSLRLLTDPSGASVFVENEFLGNTPIDIPLQNKALKIAIEAPGYKRFERNIPAQSQGIEKGKNLFAAVMKIHLGGIL